MIMADSDDTYDFSALLPFVEQLRRGKRACDGKPISRWYRVRSDAGVASLSRKSRHQLARAALAPSEDRRFLLRSQGLRSRCHPRPRYARNRHDLRPGDGGQGIKGRTNNCRSPDDTVSVPAAAVTASSNLERRLEECALSCSCGPAAITYWRKPSTERSPISSVGFVTHWLLGL